ncbi:hypothetical protein COO91_09533 (plasmid) [Nostoc flagelliforme CCNUN1]|uniref:Uncharacterized protein n=1 Tax=Nostoc flagelliforme CCNUN1 TaxID=2038116 RepID=A0A2K8T6M6_9NOSO|nr:hypothetical protein [Nostoc flagelliforme]AUB43358.1 hypothetical protein COO91_09533 [Nostoc flagelliforme CCNUN1]
MKKILVFNAMVLSLFAWSNNAFAGESRGGYISEIGTVNKAIVFRITGGVESGRPSCNTTGRFSADKDSEHYQAILTAFQMGTQITLGQVLGLGTCNLWSNSEDVRWIEINRK